MEILPTIAAFMKRAPYLAAALVGAIGALIFIAVAQNPSQTPTPEKIAPASVGKELLYTFNVDGSVEETATMDETRSPYWWLDSGGRLLIHDNIGETIQGTLPKDDKWYKEYAQTNPADTDDGVHPQNLFRLLSRSTWDNVRVEASFWILKDNLSKSENRNESNGILLMSRYVDGQTLYYTGVRVDGTAVIKKKYMGTYYTMAQKKIFKGTYDESDMPDLLPSDDWIRLRAETLTNTDGSVTVKLSQQDTATKKWKLLLSAKDDSQYDETPPITGTHPVGIRTDFMDVKFDDILMEKL